MDPRLTQFAPYLGPKCLNIGCAGNKLDGWDNLDVEPQTQPDILCRLGVDTIPVPNNTYSTVMASHILEHLPQDNLFQVFRELHRILIPGGFLIAITPYGSSDDAWDNPHHRMSFTENTFAYFSKRLYEIPDTAGYKAYEGQTYADWQIIAQKLVPYPEFAQDEDINFKKRHFRNVIQELQVVLRAAK